MKKKLFIALFVLISVFHSTVEAQQLKGDPWIFQAYKELYNGPPTAWELNIQNYNGGSWNNYGELKNYIVQYQHSKGSQGLSISTTSLGNGKIAVLFNLNGKSIAANLITNDGGTIIAQGGGNIIAQGGGNIIAQGGGNLTNLPGASFGSRYQVQSAGTKIISTSGKGALIIR